MRIQHNIPAMNSYRNYSNNVSKVAKNLEKLSTGYKINRAGDDAAGLAISEKMRIQITGLERAQDNAKAGINLVQTAEGALTEVHDMLNRMFDLAEQSANGTFDDSVDRNQLQKEVNQLREEIDRIADSTNYNGIKLLDGSMESKSVATGTSGVTVTAVMDGQVGREPQAGIFELDLTGLEIQAGAEALTPEFTVFADPAGTDAANAGMYKLSLETIGANGSASGDKLASQIAEKWNARSDAEKTLNGALIRAEATGSKVTFTMDNAPTEKWDTKIVAEFSPSTTGADVVPGVDSDNHTQAQQVKVTTLREPVDSAHGRQYAQGKFTLDAAKIKDGYTITIGEDTYVYAVGKNSSFKDAANVIDLTDLEKDSIQTNLGIVGMRLSTAAKDNTMFKVGADTQTGEITLTEREGAIDYSKYNLEGADNSTSAAADKDGKWAGLVKTGFYDNKNSTSGLTLQIGDTAEEFNQMTVSVKDTHSEALGLSRIDISKQGNAQSAMDAIKAATNYISDVRGGLGALQNRLDHTINNLSVAQENIQDAEANIRDVDVAKEMMAYTKNNILVQSAQAMLAQANQLPQGVLQLLG